MASVPSSRPPKPPTSLSDHLARTNPPAPTGMKRAPSTGSIMSAASDTSREGLRREIVRRRKSLSSSELSFLQGIVENGTEFEIVLVQQKLNDPSLCFDVDDDAADDNESHTTNTTDGDGRRASVGSSVHTPTPEVQTQDSHPSTPLLGQLLCPTFSLENDGSFDPEASIDTCATGQGKPPPGPVPLSPRRDLANFPIPSHLELYPDTGNQRHSSDLEQTPLMQNLRPPKSLEGAAPLPIPPISGRMPEEDMVTPGTNNTSGLRPAALHRRSSNPLVDQLWRAHEQGLSVTPQQSTRRLQLRREQSAASPLRRLSSSTSRTSISSMSHRSSGKSLDHSRSLLTPQELRLIKQRHLRTTSQVSPSELILQHHHQQEQPWRRQEESQIQSLDAQTMMMVLQQTSTDSSMDYNQNDISSLLLPTDEEIFRRSLQAANMQRPPAPRPFKETLVTKSTSAAVPKPPSNIQRMRSDGMGSAMPRRPSALRRMTSDGSQRSKSVSFQIHDTSNKTSPPPPLLQESNDMDDSLSTYASEHHPATEILREANSWNPRESDCSLNLHMSRPIRQESIGSTASGWEAAQAFQQELDSKLSHKDSTNSVASLNLHHAHPITQESIGSILEGANANRIFQEDLAFATASASSPTSMLQKPSFGRNESRGSVASLNLHHAHPIRQESRSSVASLNLHHAHPIRQDSIGSITEGNSALVAFRRQFSAGKGFGRRESLNSLASLDLHIDTPIIQDSIFQRQDSLESTVVEGEGADIDEAFRPTGWTRRESMSSVASMDLHRAHAITSWSLSRRDSTNSLASLSLHRAHPLRRDSIASVADGADALEAFREQVASQSWSRRDSTNSIASLNIHKSHPIRQESICSNAAGLDATESFRKEFSVEPNTLLKPTYGRQSSMGSVASLNIHKAHPLGSEKAAAIDILRNKGSAFTSESDLFELSLNDSIVSTATGKEAKEALKKEFENGSSDALRIAPQGTRMSSTSDIAALQRDSLVSNLSLHSGHSLRVASPGTEMSAEEIAALRGDSLMSIPSLHHGKPLRQDSIASTAAGLEAKELLRQQVNLASIVASEWEGVVSPDAWEDKKMENEDANYSAAHDNLVVKVKARDVPRPVFMRLASKNEWDEEGMEVAAVDELVRDLDQEKSKQLKLKTQILVPEPPEGAPRRESGSVLKNEDEAIPEREQSASSPETKQRQDGYRHFPNSLISFGSTRSSGRSLEGRSSAHKVEVSASFDESKSVDRYRGVFRGELPRSISEDELSALLMAHCKPKLARGQSDATVYPNDLGSSSWELETVEGEYDAWDAIRDEYINGYGGGGTLPFQILGTSARDVDSQPHVLSPPLMESLQSFFPIAKTHDNFWMKYSMLRDGASLHTFMQRARGARYSILAIETTDGEVFGAFTTEPWRKTWNYFGGGESFLWRMRNSRQTKCYSIIDQASMESEIDVYPWTGHNQCVQLCTHNTIAVGGGSPEHTEAEEKRDDNNGHDNSDPDNATEIKDYEWGYGLALQADLQHGSSSPCLTFGSPSLSKTHSDGSLFEIVNVELWGLTPCSNLMDAEKLELGRLFLEPSFNPNTF